jgi:GNAT superfamily N-acetyltransferase
MSSSFRLVRTDATDPAFAELVRRLDAELAERDGADHAFYAQFNALATRTHTVVAYAEDRPVGCGAIKPYGDEAAEVKRMYVDPAHRGQGVASHILQELEAWAAELGYARCVLETGRRQPEAIALYGKCGYGRIENYGPYVGVENSLCFGKWLRRSPGG